MKILKENDVFSLLKPVEAAVIGNSDIVLLPRGQVVSVVLVFGDPYAPVAYEVEAFLKDSNRYALAIVEASDIQ